VTRNARRWGGAITFTGGLIGDRIYSQHYKGDFQQTPIFIGTGDPDPHVPVERVKESTQILTQMNASVQTQIYPGLGHTISETEINLANQWVFNSRNKAAIQ
jgi:phospholipase/carboxylesterase